MNKLIAAVAGGAVMVALATTTGAVAGSLVSSKQIKDHSIKEVDLRPGLASKINKPTATIVKDGSGKDELLRSAVYRVENYTNGGGGSATVACADDEATSRMFTAIAGGVQGSESGTTETQSGFLVSASFPGRMDWDTGKPKAGRLDGWVVFGNSQHTDTLKVWALCVPTASIPVQVVDLDN